MTNFKTYKEVKQISALYDSVHQFQKELKATILTEFEKRFLNLKLITSFNTGILKMQTNLLNEACLVLEILDSPGNPRYFLTVSKK